MNLLTASDASPNDSYYRQLEQGGIVFFPTSPFVIPEADQELLRSTAQTLGSHHKNVAYKPEQDRVSNFDKASSVDPERLRAVMRNYSQTVLKFLREVFPRYLRDCRLDYASFRPQEEEDRDLPLNKRNDLLHVDAFPTRPTGGGMILRTFTNINPAQDRIWIISDSFRALADRYARDAGLERAVSGTPFTKAGSLLRGLGVPLKNRTAYDRFMLGFHDWLKANEEFQRNTPKYKFAFPPGSTWMVFTDVAPHAVLSGRYALEQTIIVKRESLLDRQDAPISILEKMSGRPLSV